VGEKRCIQGFSGETCENDTTWKTLALIEDNIQMDLREVEWEGIDWIDLAQDRGRWRALVNTVMNLRVP
jgi:hypothetical protein